MRKRWTNHSLAPSVHCVAELRVREEPRLPLDRCFDDHRSIKLLAPEYPYRARSILWKTGNSPKLGNAANWLSTGFRLIMLTTVMQRTPSQALWYQGILPSGGTIRLLLCHAISLSDATDALSDARVAAAFHHCCYGHDLGPLHLFGHHPSASSGHLSLAAQWSPISVVRLYGIAVGSSKNSRGAVRYVSQKGLPAYINIRDLAYLVVSAPILCFSMLALCVARHFVSSRDVWHG